MDETTSPSRGAEDAGERVHAVELVRRIRDDFAARTAALPPEDLIAYVAREAAAVRAELGHAGRRAPAA
jgi:hypothetical protein